MDKGYVRIRPDFLLRGWKGLPHVLVRRDGKGKPIILSRGTFGTVQLCNGRFTSDSPIFIGARHDHLAKLDEHGILEFLDEPGCLLPEQEYRLYDNRYLERVHWSLTGRCNYRCRHCYMSAPHAVLPQPTTEQCLAIADQIADCGVMHVTLTGGEPLVRSDFLEIVDRILERGIRIDMIMTNGALVDDQFLDELDARGCRPELNMSYDGPKEWHDWLRGVEGAHESVCRAFALCKERGFPTGAEMVLHKGNLHTLRESINRLGELGVRSLKVGRLSCVGEGSALTDWAITAQEEFDTYLDYIPHYFDDGMPVPGLMLSALFMSMNGRLGVVAERHPEDRNCDREVICASARATMYLGPDGRILPCIPMSQHEEASRRFPKVSELTLTEALSDSFYLNFISATLEDYLDHNQGCRACEYKNRCAGGCRGRAVESNGGSDLLGVDSDACLIFKGGYYNQVKDIIARHRDEAHA